MKRGEILIGERVDERVWRGCVEEWVEGSLRAWERAWVEKARDPDMGEGGLKNGERVV